MNRRSKLTNKVVMALVFTGLIAGLALQPLFHGDSDHSSAAASSTTAPSGPGPWSNEGGIPTGFAQTEAGAVAAASSYTTTGQTLLDLAPTQLPEAVRRYASDDSAPTQIAKLTEDMASLRQLLAKGTGRTRYAKSVLASRLDEFTKQRAAVRIWTVGVLWRQGAADPQADWTTSTYELVWEKDTWKVLTEEIESGPAPAPNGGAPPVTAEELDQMLDGFGIGTVAQ